MYNLPHISISLVLLFVLATGCSDGYRGATGNADAAIHILPDDYNRFASSIVDMPQQGQDGIEGLIIAHTGGVVRFHKTGVMQTIQYEIHVPPDALIQDGWIGLKLKDTYGKGLALEIASEIPFVIAPHLHFSYLLDVSLAEVLGYDLSLLLDGLDESQRVSRAMSWPDAMQKPHDLPVSSTPIRTQDLGKLGLYHYDNRQDRWEAEKPYIEVSLIRTEQNRRYLYIYAYTRLSDASLYALGGTSRLIKKDSERASMPARLVQDLPEFENTKIRTASIPKTNALQ